MQCAAVISYCRLLERFNMLFGGRDAFARVDYLARLIRKDGFTIDARLPVLLQGGNNRVMVKSVGLGLLGLPDIFEKLQPDVVLVHGDRFEVLAVALAAAYLNIPLAHIEGGDVSGTIDNSIRHAISKFAQVHFPVTEESAARLERMGEDPEYIVVTGSPVIDALASLDHHLDNSVFERLRFGGEAIDVSKPYVVVMFHPVTTEYETNYGQAREVFRAVTSLGIPAVFFISNEDAGADGIARAHAEYRAQNNRPQSTFFKTIPPEDFYQLLYNASVVVGNSSSFIKEASYFGTPAVLVGNRQDERQHGTNAVFVPIAEQKIVDAAQKQIAHGRYTKDFLFGQGDAGTRIASALASFMTENLSTQKHFHESSR